MEPTLVDLSTLSYVVKNELGKMAKYNAKIKDIEDKIPDITNLATDTTLHAKKMRLKRNTKYYYLSYQCFS